MPQNKLENQKKLSRGVSPVDEKIRRTNHFDPKKLGRAWGPVQIQLARDHVVVLRARRENSVVVSLQWEGDLRCNTYNYTYNTRQREPPGPMRACG